MLWHIHNDIVLFLKKDILLWINVFITILT